VNQLEHEHSTRYGKERSADRRFHLQIPEDPMTPNAVFAIDMQMRCERYEWLFFENTKCSLPSRKEIRLSAPSAGSGDDGMPQK
jgi:hypothetical protein